MILLKWSNEMVLFGNVDADDDPMVTISIVPMMMSNPMTQYSVMTDDNDIQ